jgi:cell division protein FtsB
MGQRGTNGVKAIGYSELIPVTIRSIQELNQKVEAGDQKSKDRIQKLEAENAELKARMEKLERLMGDKQTGGAK